ncbi:MAG: type IV secretion system DNA-binding domain-containing protein, partial [Acidobacteriaceae bacterium]
MSEWGRKEYTGWPSRQPVWTWAAVFVWLSIFAGGMVYRYSQQWSFAEREYLGNYLKASTLGWLWDQSYYRMLICIDKKGQSSVCGDAIESVRMVDGKPIYSLTEAGVQAGVAIVTTVPDKFHNAWVRETLGHEVYQDQTVWEYVKYPVYGSLCFLPMLLFFAVPKDRKRELEFQHGRRLRGPERVTTVEFNGKLGRRRWLRREPADGLGFINENQSWADRTLRNRMSRCVRIPRERESMHVLVMGDTGHGKSAIVRQALCQIEERGETAIVYDPAMEYLPQFYEPERGDIILNPLDERCPFWTPGDEVPHEAEALTLAASLFPEQGRENR